MPPKEQSPRQGEDVPLAIVCIPHHTLSLDLSWVPETTPVVVVHGDDDLSPRRADHPRVLHLRSRVRLGFGQAVNEALRHVAPKRLVLVGPYNGFQPADYEALSKGGPQDIIVIPRLREEAWPGPTFLDNRYPTPLSSLASAARIGTFLGRHRRVGGLVWRSHAMRRPVAPADWAETEWPGRPPSECWPPAAAWSVDADRLRAVGGFDPLHVFYPGDPDLFYSGDADLARRLSRSFPDTVVRVFLRGPLVESLAWTGADRAVMREAKLASLHRFSRDAEGAGWVAVRGVLATICAGRRCRSRVAAGDDVITPIILPPSASSPRRVSVVIPCHNYGRYLPEALTSVFCQSRPADELVVVDDGSSDDTPSVLEHLMAEHPRTTVIRRTPARGAVATFNDGVRASSGDLVVILSADDRMSDDYLEELERALDQSKADFAYSGLRGFGAGEWWTPAKPFDRRVLARGNFVNGSAMFRRDLFDRIGGFDPAFAGLRKEDWAFWLRAVNLGASGAPAAHCWLEYRQHGGIGSSRNRVGLGVVIRTHLRARRANPDVIRPVDLVVGVGHETSEAVRRWWWRGLAELAGAR